MVNEDISTEVQSLNSEFLDHSRDFVELVCRSAPGEYLRLLESEHFQRILLQKNTFNYGKLFVYAEFIVFRREFNDRFAEASPTACMNAFSGLFLKNDISISRLVQFMERSDDLEKLRLNTPEGL